MAFKFFGKPYQTYSTRGSSYTADQYGVVTVANPANSDITDLINDGCVPLGQTQALSNISATTDPTVNNDQTQDYGVGSVWINTATGVEWRALSVATGAAV